MCIDFPSSIIVGSIHHPLHYPFISCWSSAYSISILVELLQHTLNYYAYLPKQMPQKNDDSTTGCGDGRVPIKLVGDTGGVS